METPKDPIVEQIHATREAIAKASGNELERIAEAAKARQVKSGRKVVRLPPKRVHPMEKVS
jgi:hypothetical protein